MRNKTTWMWHKYAIINLKNMDGTSVFTGPDGKDYLEVNIEDVWIDEPTEEYIPRMRFFSSILRIGDWCFGRIF